MARIKNDLFQLKGSLGGLSFSQDENGTIVRQKATVSKKRIMTHPNSEGTRENMREMGGASMAAKELRLAFLHKQPKLGDRYFSGRLSGAMRKVVAGGEGKRGQRTLDLRKNASALEGFEFIKARPLIYSVGGIKEKPHFNLGRTQVSWTSPLLNRQTQITAPVGATHIAFVLGAATLPAYLYNFEEKKYIPVEKPCGTPAVYAYSTPIALDLQFIEPVTLELRLTETTALSENIAVVTVVGVKFFKNVNEELLELSNTGGMKVLGVD